MSALIRAFLVFEAIILAPVALLIAMGALLVGFDAFDLFWQRHVCSRTHEEPP